MRDAGEVELAELVVVLGARALALEDLDRDRRLLAVEEVGKELDDLRDTGRAADKDDVVDLVLRHLRVAEDLLDRLHRATEEVHVELLEASAGDRREEVDALEERVDLDRGLGRRGEGALRTLAGGAEAAHGARVAGDVLLVLLIGLGGGGVRGSVGGVLRGSVGCVLRCMHAAYLALELLDEVVDGAVVEVLAAQVRVARGRLDLEDALLNREERHIEGAAAEVEDEHVALRRRLL